VLANIGNWLTPCNYHDLLHIIKLETFIYPQCYCTLKTPEFYPTKINKLLPVTVRITALFDLTYRQ